eukprot:TRINITY_DN11535_c0_g2_i10.p1 TRINITY_DN11535_c0_g2~~TRINITY_DN11535_c0_g2_i10.p1  ORF type:complete len:252 (-),score=60.95 TRINITY_DN11535_c0_g2_i10:308-1063(-)
MPNLVIPNLHNNTTTTATLVVNSVGSLHVCINAPNPVPNVYDPSMKQFGLPPLSPRSYPAEIGNYEDTKRKDVKITRTPIPTKLPSLVLKDKIAEDNARAQYISLTPRSANSRTTREMMEKKNAVSDFLNPFKGEMKTTLVNILAQVNIVQKGKEKGSIFPSSMLNQICQDIGSNLLVLRNRKQQLYEFVEKQQEYQHQCQLLAVDIDSMIAESLKFIQMINSNMWNELDPVVSSIVESARNLTSSMNAIY